MKWNSLFTNSDPFESIKWVKRDAKITGSDGKVVFEQKDIEVPESWSQTATDIVASKYFRGKKNSPERETSVKQMVNRVAKTITQWGLKDGYFDDEQNAKNFENDLKWLLVNQYAAFNSPVWFNVGIDEHPQASACFILSVEDNMKSILHDWYSVEGMIFKHGSGTGINLSNLRSSKEPLSKGGIASGPVSFMQGADGIANTIKSGGRTRRAAKMVILNIDHPDIKDFIYCKKIMEDMSKDLAVTGKYDISIEGKLFSIYTTLPFQNANNSVRVTDEFMEKVKNDEEWELKAVKTRETIQKVKARDILNWCADAAWHCADPGMQYDTTTNKWHTCPNSGRINASNPCSEYIHIDNSACNLSSLNLLKFLKDDGYFDVELFKKAVDTMIMAQDIIVDNSSYPTEKITKNAKNLRQLGLGFANLGALLMAQGLPYDSDQGRALAGAISAIMGGEAYRFSANIAKHKNPFADYFKNREPMLEVIKLHREYAYKIPEEMVEQKELINEARSAWDQALLLGQEFGFRNSQVTVIAPTGTIAFMMDCDTTGIEPELALIKYKKLVGGGTLKLVNNQVKRALKKLRYTPEQIDEIIDYIDKKETIEGVSHLRKEHLPVFDCSFKPVNGSRSIHYLGHLKMMAAVQPFISGAISKTINLPNTATKEEIFNGFITAWELGLKSVAFYRDGCKTIQPLNTKDKTKQNNLDKKLIQFLENGLVRKRLPDERPGIHHKFSVGGHEGYINIGLYPDTNQIGETFINMAKEGSTIAGLMDTIAILTSICLQYGIPLKVLIRKLKDMRFEPMGITTNKNIPYANSVVDYIFRYLGMKFLSEEEKKQLFGNSASGLNKNNLNKNNRQAKLQNNNKPNQKNPDAKNNLSPELTNEISETSPKATTTSYNIEDNVCPKCGFIMVRAGTCMLCRNCGEVTGVCS